MVVADLGRLGDVKDVFEGAKLGFTDFKKNMAKILIGRLEPMRQKRINLSDDDVRDILKAGAKSARHAAGETMAAVRSLIYFVQE